MNGPRWPHLIPPFLLVSPRHRSFHGPTLAWVLLASIGILSSCGKDSQGGTTPTGPTTPSRATNITLTTSAITMDALGATEQLTAAVKDQYGATMGGATVSWSSSSTSVATVSSSGLVTATGNGSADITASSGSASAQATVTVRQEAATAEITPGSAELMVNQVVVLDLDLRDRNGNELEDAIVAPSWSSSSPSVAAVSESGTVRGVSAGTTQIEATAGAVVAASTISVAEASTPEVETGSVTGAVEVPASVDSAAVWVYSGVSGAVTLASDGSFVSETAVDQEGTLIAMNGDRLLGLSIKPPAGSAAPASSPRAAATAVGVMIDARTTAVALVFLTPLFAAAPPGVTQEILDLIDGLAEIDALEAEIRASVEDTGGMPDGSDAAFVGAYRAAVQAAHQAMAARAGLSTQELIEILLVPDQNESGVKLDFPEGDGTPVMTVMVQNVYGRDVDVYLTEADAEGNPRQDLANLSSYKVDRVLQLPPADYVPDITSISEWISLFGGNYGPDDPTPLSLTFTTANPRYLLYAYGPGVSGLGSDLASIEGSENWRWAVPSAFTATFGFVLPIIEATGGFKFIPKMKLGGGYTDLRSLVETLVDVAEIFRCVGNDSSQSTVIICLGDQMQSLLLDNPDVLARLIQSAAAAGGQNLTTNTINGVLNNVIPVVKLVSLASTLGDLFVTSYAIGGSELRQEFDLSYNGLLGATALQVVSGDNQEANRGQTLGDPLAVKVVDAAGTPIPNAWVEWKIISGGGSHSGSTVKVADGSGLSSVSWTLGDDGDQKLRARLAGSAATAVTFSAGLPVPSRLESVASSVTGRPGSEIEAGAQVLTAAGNPVAGHDVTFTVVSSHGTLSGATTQTVTTGSDGAATVSWTLPDAEGRYQLTATAEYEGSPLTGSPVKIRGTATTCANLGCGFGDAQFALIPAGTFQMGSTNGRSDERPVHTVTLTKSFYIQKTEMTQGQWKAVMGSNPSFFSSCGDDCPVDGVSWNDIQKLLNRLNAVDPGKNYRLPTEAEWEYAARAGTTGDYGGNGVLNDMGWNRDNSGGQAHPVAQKLANAWGLYDMHGNVWEWVRDWYSSSYYSVSPATDPPGPSTGLYRVLRGGSRLGGAYGARSAFRALPVPPSTRSYQIGFRLARTP